MKIAKEFWPYLRLWLVGYLLLHYYRLLLIVLEVSPEQIDSSFFCLIIFCAIFAIQYTAIVLVFLCICRNSLCDTQEGPNNTTIYVRKSDGAKFIRNEYDFLIPYKEADITSDDDNHENM